MIARRQYMDVETRLIAAAIPGVWWTKNLPALTLLRRVG